MVKVIFDNEYHFCTGIKNNLKKIDIFQIFIWASSNEFLKKNNHELITDKIVKSSIVIFINKKKVLTDFEACRFIVSRIPFFIPILLLFYIPFLSNYFGVRLYRIIAKNRKCYV